MYVSIPSNVWDALMNDNQTGNKTNDDMICQLLDSLFYFHCIENKV